MQDAKWVSLFDGKSLEGWEKVGKEDSVWEVKDGALMGPAGFNAGLYQRSL